MVFPSQKWFSHLKNLVTFSWQTHTHFTIIYRSLLSLSSGREMNKCYSTTVLKILSIEVEVLIENFTKNINLHQRSAIRIIISYFSANATPTSATQRQSRQLVGWDCDDGDDDDIESVLDTFTRLSRNSFKEKLLRNVF